MIARAVGHKPPGLLRLRLPEPEGLLVLKGAMDGKVELEVAKMDVDARASGR